MEVERGEEEYSFCYMLTMWFTMFGVCQLGFAFVALWTAPSFLGGKVLSLSTQYKALGMGKADGGRVASYMYLPGDSAIPLGN